MTTALDQTKPKKVIILDADKFTSNGKKFGRPKNQTKSKPTTKPIRVPIEQIDRIQDLDDLISVLESYTARCDHSPRWYFFKQFIEELPKSFW